MQVQLINSIRSPENPKHPTAVNGVKQRKISRNCNRLTKFIPRVKLACVIKCISRVVTCIVRVADAGRRRRLHIVLANRHASVAVVRIGVRVDHEKCHLGFHRSYQLHNLQGAPIKNNPLEKVLYLENCSRFFHHIYAVYRGGFRQCFQQIAFKYLV